MVASDIDGTLCVRGDSSHSRRVGQHTVHIVDSWSGGAAVTTDTVRRVWRRLAARRSLIPATARSMEQFRRIRWPGPTPAWAVVLNGAVILRDGVVDQSWGRFYEHQARGRWNPIIAERLVRAHIADWRLVDVSPGCFVKSRSFEAPTTEEVAELRAAALAHSMVCSVQGRSVYLGPQGLGKREALAWIADRVGAIKASAGDSAHDVDMLRWTSKSICPRGSEAHSALLGTSTSVADGTPLDQVSSIAVWLEFQSLKIER